ncbi:MAG TPA: HYR domain-containing protein, partial [Archangium sp.]|nr:HYR domain-containing protein [Archangium sp.]
GGTLLGVASVPDALPVGGSSIATISVASTAYGASEVWAVVDDDGTGTGTTSECREDNNGSSAMGNLSCVTTPANQPPVALCRDVTVNADVYCMGSASVDNGSYDPDNGPSPLSISEVPYTSLPLGTHPVTLTASDGELSAQCVGNVTVVDTAKPAVSCPASQVLETCSPAGAPATFAASATDNCGPAPVSCSYASGSTFPVGETAVSCSATDGSGNTASCGFNVTVTGDTTPPVLNCPSSPVVVNACGEGGSTANFSVSATDNCGEVAVTCSHASGSEFPAGNTEVSCSATDAFGNTSSCGFSVQVSGASPSTPPTPGADLGTELWAPNHKYEYAPLLLSECAAPATDACGKPLPLEKYGRILRVTSDEVEDANGNGDGRTCEDMVIVSPTSVKLRAEREGTGNGRVYTLHYVVTNDAGVSTQSSCRVHVPHDQSGRGAVDSGVKFCVGEGCPAGTTEGSLLCK